MRALARRRASGTVLPVRPDELVSAFRVLLEAGGLALTGDGGAGRDAHAAWTAFADLAVEPVYEPYTHRSGRVVHVEQAMDGDLLRFETALRPGALLAEFTRQLSFVDQDDEYVAMDGLTLAVHLEAPLAQPGPALIWGTGGPPFTDAEWARRGEPPRPFRAAAEWREEVERSEAFRALFADDARLRFSFSAVSA